MAGPTYYHDKFHGSKNRLPKYYDGKVFHYDWSRNWIHAVTLDQEGNFLYQEPFLPNFQFEKIIDMELGPDGAIYVLEYGANWFAQNPDAVLARIDFSEGNRQPVARIQGDLLVGAAPLKVNFSAKESFDFDEGDALAYEWYFEGDKPQAEGVETSFTFLQPGIYRPKVKVTDPSGSFHTAQMEVQVGNEPPQVAISLTGNKSFYWPNTTLGYQVQVTDKEDGKCPTRRYWCILTTCPLAKTSP
jgi:cytochrome c